MKDKYWSDDFMPIVRLINNFRFSFGNEIDICRNFYIEKS